MPHENSSASPVACVDLDQRDEDTRYREIASYMQAYWNALSDVSAEGAERTSSARGGRVAAADNAN
jgi:hypothetical protein